MKNFTCYLNTKVYFGKGQITSLSQELIGYKSILLVYGSGSIKSNGIYNSVVDILRENNVRFVELPDIQPNPRIQSVRKGIQLCREHQVDLILAVGAGSVIDCSKAISFGVDYQGDPWDFFIGKAEPQKAIRVGTVLTLSATGSEMNPYCVISNTDTGQKYGAGSEIVLPAFSILDPEYTFSVPHLQTAAGSADILSHVFEQYFSPGNTYIQDRMAEAIMKTVIYWTPIALSDPLNYEARANLMWAGSIALNGLLEHGKNGDWATHLIEHEISAVNDLTHGVGLAIIFPNWMKNVLSENTLEKFVNFGLNVWGISPSMEQWKIAEESIECLRSFFNECGLPDKLKVVGIKESDLESIAKKTVSISRSQKVGQFKKLTSQDILNILNTSY